MSTFVVTGGAGFIGSAIARSLLASGCSVIVVDDPSRPGQQELLSGLQILDCIEPCEFLGPSGTSVDLRSVDAVIHQGAISSTMHPDVDELYRNNLDYSQQLLDACLSAGTPMIYASSAAVYGRSQTFREVPEDEAPLNHYGRSKLGVDRIVREVLPTAGSQVVGLRYFNVYGTGEDHKGPMASMVHQLDQQLRTTGVAKLFGASHGVAAGEQSRDFVHVDDVVAVVEWFLDRPDVSGIFNVGTGRDRTFNEVAHELIRRHGSGRIEYFEVPESLRSAYQPLTRADLTRLRSVGYDAGFVSLEEGVGRLFEQRAAGVGS